MDQHILTFILLLLKKEIKKFITVFDNISLRRRLVKFVFFRRNQKNSQKKISLFFCYLLIFFLKQTDLNIYLLSE